MEASPAQARAYCIQFSDLSSSQKKNRGFTLIQLMASIAVICITLSVGIPSVSAIIETNRLAKAFNTLSRHMALARSEAVKRQQEVVVCVSKDGKFCTRQGGWEQGWLVFADEDGDELRSEEEQILWVQQSLGNSMKIKFSPFPSDATHHVYYWSSGFTKMNGTFTLCPQNSQQAPRALILNKIGRVRKSSTKRDGKALECS